MGLKPEYNVSPTEVQLFQIQANGYLTFPIPTDVQGITSDEVGRPCFNQWKKEAIRFGAQLIVPLLKRARTNDLLLPYLNLQTDTTSQSPSRRLSTVFTLDKVKNYFHDDAQFFRGLTIADLLIAAIVNEGKIVARIPSDNKSSVAVTTSTREAVSFAQEYTDSGLSYGKIINQAIHENHRDILYKMLATLQLPTDVNTLTQLEQSILLSPVVLRFKKKQQKGNIFKRLSYLLPGYFDISPYLTLDDITTECLNEILRVTGIDIIAIRDAVRTKELK